MFDAGIFPSGNSSLEINRTAKGAYTWSFKIYFAKTDKYNLQLVIKRAVVCKNLLETLLGQKAEVEIQPGEPEPPGMAGVPSQPPTIDAFQFPPAGWGMPPPPKPPVSYPPEAGVPHAGMMTGTSEPRGLFQMFDDVLRRSEIIDDLFQMWEDIKSVAQYMPEIKKQAEAQAAKARKLSEEAIRTAKAKADREKAAEQKGKKPQKIKVDREPGDPKKAEKKPKPERTEDGAKDETTKEAKPN